MKTRRKLPSVRVLRRLLDLDPETGTLTWKERPVWIFREGVHGRASTAKGWNTKYAGKPALAASTGAYCNGSILGRRIQAHRVIYAMHNGHWAADEVDHINGDPSNNRPSNLRSADRTEQMKNRARPVNNTSGIVGVSWHKQRRLWVAHVSIDGRAVTLGTFTRKRDAIRARRAAERKYGFHKNHGRR